MERVHRFAESQIPGECYAAVAIQSVNENQRHIGVLHRAAADDPLQLLHLEWHCRLSNGLQGVDSSFLWIDSLFHPRRLKQVAAICRKVYRANRKGGVPYAFSSPSECFDTATGQFLLGPTRNGLTCATFVLAVFESAGIILVDYASWPIGREGDQVWQEAIVATFQRFAAEDSHIQAVQNEIGSARFRPEEVAGPAGLGTPRVSFVDAEFQSHRILAKLSSEQ